MVRTTSILLIFLLGMSSNLLANQKLCSYESYQWSTLEKLAVNRHLITHPYSETTGDEIDPVTGCTVCSEDQVELVLPGIKPFRVCKVVASSIETALTDLLAAGEPINQVIGYRVGKTRGKPDNNGLRTRFSNHSYGIAIDINPDHNGLYDHCLYFSQKCRLIRGGPWKPHSATESLDANGAVVRRFKQEGFHWGGEIRGKQKDFMHFSPTGY